MEVGSLESSQAGRNAEDAGEREEDGALSSAVRANQRSEVAEADRRGVLPEALEVLEGDAFEFHERAFPLPSRFCQSDASASRCSAVSSFRASHFAMSPRVMLCRLLPLR